MAALMRLEALFRDLYSAFKVGNVKKYSSLPPKKKPPKRIPGPLIYHNKQKLETKGYLRPLKGYYPPEDVEEKFHSILTKHAKELMLSSELKDPLIRFKILEACFQTFQHGVPNSLLHTINNVGDILQFYKSPLETMTPLEHMRMKDLPQNLHILHDIKRFDPDDPLFGGVSAFPKSGTLITGLKSKKKYKTTEPQNWTKDWREHSLGYIRW